MTEKSRSVPPRERKLSEEAVRSVRERYLSGEHLKVLAAEHDCSITTIARCAHGLSYKKVLPIPNRADLVRRAKLNRILARRAAAMVMNQ